MTQDSVRTQDLDRRTPDSFRRTQDSDRRTQDSVKKTQDSVRKIQDLVRKTQNSDFFTLFACANACMYRGTTLSHPPPHPLAHTRVDALGFRADGLGLMV